MSILEEKLSKLKQEYITCSSERRKCIELQAKVIKSWLNAHPVVDTATRTNLISQPTGQLAL